MTDPSPLPTTLLLPLVLSSVDEAYGAELVAVTGLHSGIVHPALDRLAARGWIEGRDEVGDPHALGRPLRRYYRLTDAGRRQVLAWLQTIQRLAHPHSDYPTTGGFAMLFNVDPIKDSARNNPDVHYRLYKPKGKPVTVVCVQDFDYYDYHDECFVNYESYPTERAAAQGWDAIVNEARRIIAMDFEL